MKNVLAKLTGVQLVEIYNQFSPRPIKKFTDVITAQARVQKLLEEHGKSVWFVDDSLKVGDAKDAPKPPRKPIGAPPKHNHMIVRLVVTENPKNKNTASRARFDLYKDGMTVRDYCVAADKLESEKGNGATHYMKDIRWDQEKNFITLEEPAVD